MTLSAERSAAAISYNRNRLVRGLPLMRQAVGLPAEGGIDEGFVNAVANWQSKFFGPGRDVDGKVGPKTEACFNIPHPRALAAAENALAIHKAGLILFDSWGNDARDNNMDGLTDGAKESGADGSHFAGLYPKFQLVKGPAKGLGWNKSVTLDIKQTRTIYGPFRYRVCSDIVSQAYAAAGVMPHTRSTAHIMQTFRKMGYLFRASEGFPNCFLPGDYIATYAAGHGGHSGIVVETKWRRDGWPTVVDLPGPSTLADKGWYDPASTSDIRKGIWIKSDLENASVHYLGRLLHTQVP